jgi:hypothetical protein
MVCVPVREYPDGEYGFLTAARYGEEEDPEGPEAEQQPPGSHGVVAFQDRSDAEQVQWLWETWDELEPGVTKCAAFPRLSFAPFSLVSLFAGPARPLMILSQGRSS